MIRRATDRLLVAATVTVLGALLAVLTGVSEAALLVTPWAVLLALGLSQQGRGRASATTAVATDRLLAGDDVEVVTSVTGGAGSVDVTVISGTALAPGTVGLSDRYVMRVADVLVAGRATVRCSFPALHWGTHEVGRVRIRVTEPYGLFRWEGVVAQSRLLRVHPRPIELENLLAPWLARQVSGVHRSKAAGRGVEYADLRPYSPGDSLREINWRASARSPELWVSQRHPDRATDVVLLLDSFVESGHDVRTVFGLSIAAAVALAESHLGATDRVGLIEMGGVLRWVGPGTGRHQLQRLVDTLLATGLYANVAQRPIRLIPPRALPPRSFVVALTPLLDERFIEALFVLGARGHDVAVIECDSGGPEPADADSAASHRVAQRLWEAERQVVRDKLAESGIVSARWRPEQHLDLTLRELTRRRRHTARVSRR